MITVTGDLHGDITRFKSREIKKLRKGDTLIVCGDFGFVWDGSKEERRLLDWIGKRPFQTLFVEGTHDNLDLLEQVPQVDFCGGKARHLGGRLYHLCRGEIFTIEGRRIFALGGGESPDADDREAGVSWWPQELPSRAELDAARARLERVEADVVVTHECSTRMMGFLGLRDDKGVRVTPLHKFLDELEEGGRFRHWYFGCHHIDKRISSSFTAVYRALVEME